MAVDDFTGAAVLRALAALGDSAEQVADTLMRAGFRGKPECETTCPVAEYLGSIWDAERFAVAVVAEPPTYVLVAEVFRWADAATVAVEVPAAVSGFVRAFDDGQFADLDRRREPTAVAA